MLSTAGSSLSLPETGAGVTEQKELVITTRQFGKRQDLREFGWTQPTTVECSKWVKLAYLGQTSKLPAFHHQVCRFTRQRDEVAKVQQSFLGSSMLLVLFRNTIRYFETGSAQPMNEGGHIERSYRLTMETRLFSTYPYTKSSWTFLLCSTARTLQRKQRPNNNFSNSTLKQYALENGRLRILDRIPNILRVNLHDSNIHSHYSTYHTLATAYLIHPHQQWNMDCLCYQVHSRQDLISQMVTTMVIMKVEAIKDRYRGGPRMATRR